MDGESVVNDVLVFGQSGIRFPGACFNALSLYTLFAARFVSRTPQVFGHPPDQGKMCNSGESVVSGSVTRMISLMLGKEK